MLLNIYSRTFSNLVYELVLNHQPLYCLLFIIASTYGKRHHPIYTCCSYLVVKNLLDIVIDIVSVFVLFQSILKNNKFLIGPLTKISRIVLYFGENGNGVISIQRLKPKMNSNKKETKDISKQGTYIERKSLDFQQCVDKFS